MYERLFTDWREMEQKSSFPESHLNQHQLPERIAVNDATAGRPFQADGPPDVFSARRGNARWRCRRRAANVALSRCVTETARRGGGPRGGGGCEREIRQTKVGGIGKSRIFKG